MPEDQTRKRERHKSSAGIFYEFTQNVSIHGIKYTTGSHSSKFIKFIWFVFVLVCIGTCGYFLVTNMERFFAHNIKTTSMVEFVHQVTFPAITICNENLARRSVVGASPEFIKGLAAYLVANVKDYEEYVATTLATCIAEKHEGSAFLDTGYTYWATMGFARGCQYMTADSEQSVKRCKWRQEEINCTDIFLNHITDYGWCFTFNPSPELLKMYKLGLSNDSEAYGVSVDFTPFSLVSAGPNNGLQLLLDVRQDDYCMQHSNDAAGFKVLVHDPAIQPLFFLDKALSISPGFNYDVAIKFERAQKKTESLGRCTHMVNMPLYPSLGIYFREACYVQCFSDFVYDKCTCIPPFGPPGAASIKGALMNVTSVPTCWGYDLICMRMMEREFLNVGLDNSCPYCKPECNVTKHHVSPSSSYFPALNMVGKYEKYLPEHFRNLSNVESVTKIRENLILVNFYIESKQLSITIEVEDFTGDQLLSAVGGTVGFFLGMSVLSAMEIFQVLLFMAFPSLRVEPANHKEKSNSEIKSKHIMDDMWLPPATQF